MNVRKYIILINLWILVVNMERLQKKQSVANSYFVDYFDCVLTLFD